MKFSKVKLLLVGIAVAVLLVGGSYAIGSYIASAQMGTQPPAVTQKPDPMEQIAAALERIAAAMEKSAGGPGMMSNMGTMGPGMMQGMGQMQGMMGMRARMHEMMNATQSKISCATAWLERAIQLHQTIHKDPASATEASHQELMDQMMKARECLTGMPLPGMMQGMGPMQGMMGQMGPGMMGDMSGMMAQMQQMMQRCETMMQGMQGMMGQMPMAPQSPSVAAAPGEADLTRASSEGGVEVKVTYMNPLLKPEEAASKLVFKVALSTHTVDLSKSDLTKMVALRTSTGLTITEGFVWEPLGQESGHHRTGLLKVADAAEGKSVITPETKSLELELKDVAAPSRLFRWELQK